jgi:hypothetical protein
MKIIRTAKYKIAQQSEGRYEVVHFEEGEYAKPVMDTLRQDEQAAVGLIFDQWKTLHEGSGEKTNRIGRHETDTIKTSGSYVLFYNINLGYVGLLFDTHRGAPPPSVYDDTGFGSDERDFSGDYDPYAGTGHDEPPGSY